MSDLIKNADPAAQIAIKKANKHWTDGNNHAEKAVAEYLKVGDCLNLARSYFEGDRQFGEFRAKAMPNISAKWAGDLMRIAARFEVEKLPNMKISVLKEIATASDEVVSEVLERAETDNPVTVKEARAKVKKERIFDVEVPEDDDGPDVGGDATSSTGTHTGPTGGTYVPISDDAPSAPPREPAKSPEQKEAILLAMGVEDRMAKAENFWHYVGLSMFFDNKPAYDTCYQLKCYFCTKYPEYNGRIEAAYRRDAQ